jgi:hypothetical protein
MKRKEICSDIPARSLEKVVIGNETWDFQYAQETKFQNFQWKKSRISIKESINCEIKGADHADLHFNIYY